MFEKLIEESIAGGCFPGISLVVEKDGKRITAENYGQMSYDDETSVSSDTLFDLASLTKPLATTPTLLALLEAEGLDTDKTLSFFLDEINEVSGSLTLHQLMTHTSGLPPVPEIFRLFKTEADIDEQKGLRHLYSLVPDLKPGTEVIYSCTGYILLAQVLRKISGMSLAEVFHKLILEPLGITDLMFKPAGGDKLRCASTEFCSWRCRQLKGEVHDENSWCLGGEGGNAGLFGTAEAVTSIADLFIHDGVLNGRQILKPESVRKMTSTQSGGLQPSRALGFLTQSAESFAGPGFSSASFGHTGFTGTSLWIDPVMGLKVTALTNRVNFGRDNTADKIKVFRLELHSRIRQLFSELPANFNN